MTHEEGEKLKQELHKQTETQIKLAKSEMDVAIATLKHSLWTLVAWVAGVIALLGTLGVWTFLSTTMEKKLDSIQKSAEVRSKALDLQIETNSSRFASILSNFQTTVANASRQPFVVMATDYKEDDPYVVAMIGRMIGAAPESRLPLYLELPIGSNEAAAARLHFLSRYLPKETLIAALYNPGGLAKDLFIGTLPSGRHFIGYASAFSDYFIDMEGGIRDTWQLHAPRGSSLSDSSMRGLGWIAPTAAVLAKRGTNEVDLSNFGNKFEYVRTTGIKPSPGTIAGWVVFVDKWGNCLTSLRTKELIDVLGDRDKPFSIEGVTNGVRLYQHLSEVQSGTIFAMDFDGVVNILKKNGNFAHATGTKEATRVIIKP